jgi:hypothetical protein
LSIGCPIAHAGAGADGRRQHYNVVQTSHLEPKSICSGLKGTIYALLCMIQIFCWTMGLSGVFVCSDSVKQWGLGAAAPSVWPMLVVG